ncbi:MAG: hypothetical protein EOL90_13125, partial [Spartobacteria bacterium]|nr:hypothetical protein [Spartobacteria bacterium]
RLPRRRRRLERPPEGIPRPRFRPRRRRGGRPARRPALRRSRRLRRRIPRRPGDRRPARRGLRRPRRHPRHPHRFPARPRRRPRPHLSRLRTPRFPARRRRPRPRRPTPPLQNRQGPMIQNLLRSVENAAKVFTFHVKFPQSFYVLRKIYLAAGALLLAGAAHASAASPFAVSAARETFADQPAVRVAFDFPADHHLYASFAVADPAGTALAPLSVPAPDTNTPDDPLGPSYSTSFAAIYAAPAAESVVVSYQGCAGAVCFMPEEVTLSIGAGPANAIATASASAAPAASAFPLADRGEPRRLVGYADVPAFLAFLDPATAAPESASAWKLFLDDPAQFYLRRGLVPSILLILIGGFLLNLTPCVLPMIPINLAIIGASGTDSTRAARFGLGLVYGLGMALVYGALGLVVVLTGSVFGAINSSPVFNGAIAVLFFALALAMFDVWQLDFSRFRKTGGLAGRARLPAVLVMGGISALLAGACVAPVL